MFSILNEFQIYLFPFVIAFLLALAGFRAGSLFYSPDMQRLRKRARSILKLLIYAGLAEVVSLAAIILIWFQNGWLIVRDKIILIVPLMVLPAIVVCIFAIPRLLRIVRQNDERMESPSGSVDLRAAADPALVVPVQTAAAGGWMALYLSLIPAHAPFWTDVLLTAALLIAFVAALWTRKRIQFLLLADSSLQVPSIGQRVLKSAAFILILIVGAASVFLYERQASMIPEQLSMVGHNVDFGGGTPIHHSGNSHGQISVTELTGADRFVLVSLPPDFLRSREQRIIRSAHHRIERTAAR